VKQVLTAYAIGLIFGLGLTVSQMINPAKVLAFLDITGAWDPSLALVMASALAVTAIGYRLVWRRRRPLAGGSFQVPSTQAIDARLIGGSVLFGLGWGLAGLCPGPAIAALGTGRPDVAIFFAAMLTGMIGYRLLPQPDTALVSDG